MQKMKKRKMLAIAASLILIALFTSNSSVIASTTHTVEYPETVKLGETIDVNLVFSYDIEANCLFGQYVWLQWMVNDETTAATWTYGLREYIYNLENYPRISNVTFSYDTLVMYYGNLAVDDVFTFKMYYYTGYDWGDKITFEGIARTDTYEITITSTTDETGLSMIGLTLALITVAAIVTRKKRS